jgi:nucleotide-binding universal stress UspA family protein
VSQPNAVLLIATDGLPQSDAAISFARVLPPSARSSVLVLNVVDHAPIPWGNVDRSLILTYERELYEDAERRTKEQVTRLGDDDWKIEVKQGKPAETIAAAAEKCGAQLILLGLGEHGPQARLFGNETALRTMRASRTPVLAIAPELKELPHRLLVAMDFREACIDAASIALNLAAPGATVTLAHVIPWERREYVPETWLSDYERHVTEQLVRVIGWLGRHGTVKIDHVILYGRPGRAISAYAAQIKADLIVSGTHGRGALSRVFLGDTLTRLIRGAKRSVLVVPAAAAFSGHHKSATEHVATRSETESLSGAQVLERAGR